MEGRELVTENCIRHDENATYFSNDNGTKEGHLIVQSPERLGTIEAWNYIQQKIEKFKTENGFGEKTCFLFRVFFSDIENQIEILKNSYPDTFSGSNSANISLVHQQPLPHAKLAVWAYFLDSVKQIEKDRSGNIFKSNGLTHIFTPNLRGVENYDPQSQTEQIFRNYVGLLENFNGKLNENSIRTWLYVRDIDSDYDDIIKGRKNVFEENSLSKETHYIASTGIEGRTSERGYRVFMDAYSILGIKKEQIKFLHAPAHLCPTHKYGVTFERGTEVLYGDRKHVFISGTASINNQGKIVNSNNVSKQTERTIENISALLDEAECSLEDLASAIVYIRDTADYPVVKNIIEQQLHFIPYTILLAPVCRAGWLIEIECMAVKKYNSEFPDF